MPKSDQTMNKILQGDSWKLVKELPDEYLDSVVTSPPYWGLRDYGTANWQGGDVSCIHEGRNISNNRNGLGTGSVSTKANNSNISTGDCIKCNAKRIDLQAGLEEHPQMWVDKMVELCELLKPKLKKSGVMFWNIGETYYGGNSMQDEREVKGLHKESCLPGMIRKVKEESNWLQPKQLLGLPWRFAIAMQDKGWILRNAVIWYKPNHMPSSVKDRFSNGYEYVFMFVKSRKYWFDLDAVRIPHQYPADVLRRMRQDDDGIIPFDKNSNDARRSTKNLADKGQVVHTMHKNRAEGKGEPELNSSGKNCGDVWRITTKPHPFAHFAVFPEELAERCIKSGCPEWVCKKCGKPRERIIENEIVHNRVNNRADKNVRPDTLERPPNDWKPRENKTVGWSDCGCNAGWQGGICLDPFMGSGTVAVVAKRLNRQYLGFELNEKYIEIAENRLKGITDWQTIKDIEKGVQKVLNGTTTGY